MNLITIIPISRGIGADHLTYFSIEQPVLGSLVEVPLRGRNIMGLVTMVESAKTKKTELKNLPYGMKRMERIAATDFLLPTFISAVHDISTYYAATSGAVLSVLVPKTILEALDTVVEKQTQKGTKNRKNGTNNNTKHTETLPKNLGDISAIQASDEERYSAYKSLIREEFARKKSVFLVLSSREEINNMYAILGKGIDHHTYIFHTGLSKKVIRETWKSAVASEHPVLVIATGYFLSLPREDVSTIIIDAENSRGFSVPSRPFLDLRTVAEIYAQKTGIRLIYGAQVLRVETMWRMKENDIAEFGVLKFRAIAAAECILVDMRTSKPDKTEHQHTETENQKKKEFVILGETLRATIDEARKEQGHIFLLSARKGLSSLTVCGDCGQTVSCTNCGGPTVLYKDFFVCRRCGEKRPTDTMCSRCGSWKLLPLGIGIETVEREISRLYPESPLFVLDKDHVKTHTQADTLARKFFNTPGSILLGTELAIPYLKTFPLQNSLGFSGAVSIDALFAIPEFRMPEKIMNMLISLRAVTEKKMIVQTRRPEEKVFEYALRGNLSDFYRDEISERERFGYPPFHTFIKISLEGKKAAIRSHMERTQEMLKPYDLHIFESQHPANESRHHMVHGLLIIKRKSWPDPALLEKLRMLTPEYMIKVDPENVL